MPEPTRLAQIRDDLLTAQYHLCTSKAELLTDFLDQDARSRRRLGPIRRGHLAAWRRSVAKQSRGVAGSRWARRAHDGLLTLYEQVGQETVADRLRLYGEGLAHVLTHAPLVVHPGELIVGNAGSHRISAPLHPDYGGLLLIDEVEGLDTRAQNPIARTDAQVSLVRDRLAPAWFDRSVLSQASRYSSNPALAEELTDGSAFILTQVAGISHVTPDYPAVVREGLGGVLSRIRSARAELASADERHAFYQAAEAAVEGAIHLGRRWRRHLLTEAAATSDPQRQSELRRLAAVFLAVPERPAETLHQALQSIWLTHVALHQESFQHGVSFGRMDQYLQPLYAADLAAGRTTREEAVELLGCFLAKAAELLPLFFDRATEYFSGLSSASGITLGGRRDDGSDAVNEVTWLLLEAYDQLRLRQPNLHVRVHEATDPAFLQRCGELIAGGGGMPALFNDEGIVEALVDEGFPRSGAMNFSVVGCAEWGVPYRSFPSAGAVFVNLPHALLQALTADHNDMDAVLRAFSVAVRDLVRVAAEGNNAIERAHANHRPTPLLSALVGGCIGAGRDVTAGGATHDTSGLQGVGLADVVDSLVAVHRAVFDEKWLTWRSLRAALDDDLGDETLRARLRDLPRHGEDDPLARHYAAAVSEIFAAEVRGLENGRGGRYLPGFWTMTTHQGFGRRTGALPSGRRAGEALSNGVSPSVGSERRGPTAVLCSVSAVTRVGNGYVLNTKLAPDVASKAGVIPSLVRGFFAQGGLQLQVNVLDADVLRDARANPEKHRDLVVRISGYSAYFVDLTDAMKDELIARACHRC